MQPRRIILFIISLLLVGPMGLPQQAAQAAPKAQAERCFHENPQIQHCIRTFRTFWEQNGGLQIFGYPVSAEQLERNADTGRTHLTQWFERNRFEVHPENRPPYNVLLGLLGADRLAQLGRNWQAEGREAGPKAGCLWFAQTGHNICDQDPKGSVAADRGFMSYCRLRDWPIHGSARITGAWRSTACR